MRRLQTDPDRLDWFAVLLDLQRRGLPTTLVSRQIRVPKSTVLGWKQGAEPKHVDGEALVDLWMRVTSKLRHELPRLGGESREPDRAGSAHS